MEAVVYEATNGHLEKSESGDRKEKQAKQCCVLEDGDDLVLENGLSRLPSTQPVDIQFENVAFTASLGFRKGLWEVH